MTAPATIRTEDYHTAGEPFRIVTGGAPPLNGGTVLDRRAWAAANADDVRRLLVNEPRGHADMYGCHIVPPDDAGAAFGAVFFHKDGYSTACGHGTIALGAWAVHSGMVVAPPDGETDVVIDVPSGRVVARVRTVGGRVTSVVFRNVPSWVAARNLTVTTPAGTVVADLAWGGAIYASVCATDIGLRIVKDDLPRLIELGRHIKWALDDHDAARHPGDERLSGVYGTILWEEAAGPGGAPHQRNVTVFADGEVDRSPCGSGTSARLALLDSHGDRDADRRLEPEDGLGAAAELVHDSIIGTTFVGRIVGRTDTWGRPSVITEIEGTSYRTGRHEFILDPDDDLGTGFQLR